MHKKRCRECDSAKPLQDFYRHPSMLDGHLNKCKECTRRRVLAYRNANREKVRAYDRARRPALGTIPRLAPGEAKRRIAVRRLTARAVALGALIRKPCEACGSTVDVHAHHDDYSKPLDVTWLCKEHHQARHAAIGWTGLLAAH